MPATWVYRNEQDWQKSLSFWGFHLVLACRVLGHQSAQCIEGLIPSMNETSWSFKSTLTVPTPVPLKSSCLTWGDFEPSFPFMPYIFSIINFSQIFLQCFLANSNKESPCDHLYPRYFPFQCILWIDGRITVLGKRFHHHTQKDSAAFTNLWPVYLHRVQAPKSTMLGLMLSCQSWNSS